MTASDQNAWQMARFGRKLILAAHVTYSQGESMTRHLIDNRPVSDGGRVRNYLRIERDSGDEGSHTASRQLHQRPEDRLSAARAKNYYRIDRGHTA